MKKQSKKTQLGKKKLSEKGFFSFIIVLVLAVVILTITAEQQKTNSIFVEIKNELIKNEQSHKEKIIMENNTDTIIQTELTKQMILRNFNQTLIENAINSRLFDYLKDKTKTFDSITKTSGTLSMNYLNENTKAFIYEIEGIMYGEYIFSSNLTKSSTIKKELGEKTKQEFMIPAGYTIRKILGEELLELN